MIPIETAYFDAAAVQLTGVSEQTPGSPTVLPGGRANQWRVKGDRSVRPLRIHDDGSRTYLEWGAEQSLPAVFAVGSTGSEEVVDGYMRDGVFVIDRMHHKLVFRIDKDKAIAVRRGSAK
jgi:type IV secretion system protein VirB9